MTFMLWFSNAGYMQGICVLEAEPNSLSASCFILCALWATGSSSESSHDLPMVLSDTSQVLEKLWCKEAQRSQVERTDNWRGSERTVGEVVSCS